jgi:hypothetical protein
MKVSAITINTGNLPRESGFANGRLDQVLGLVNQGTGARFAFAFQIAFDLEGVSGNDVTLKRRVTHKNDYTQRGFRTAAQVLADYELKPLLNADPGLNEDSPNPGNIKREAHRVIVQDGPGPSFGISDKSMYPMRFEGKFILMLKNANDQLLASVEYYVRLLKRTADGKVEGEFRQIVETIVLPTPLTMPGAASQTV